MNQRSTRGGINKLGLVLLLVFVVASAVGFWFFWTDNADQRHAQHITTTANCSATPVLTLPLSLSEIAAVYYPGQIRDNVYRSDGGFLLKSSTNEVQITLPLQAHLISGASYISNGETKYSLTFETNCKIRLHFDRLATISIHMSAELDKLAPSEDSTVERPLSGKEYGKGEILATRAGDLKTNSGYFWFGMYDMNHANTASEDKYWAAASTHQTEQITHGVCWLSYINDQERPALLSLPSADTLAGKTSDYCK